MNPAATCRVLADDLTGALDCAAAFAAAGPVPVALGSPEGLPWPAPVEVCATASRGVALPEMRRRLGACVDWLAAAALAFKKIDSLLRGNSLAELAWLADSGRFRRLVVAPAFPAMGRRVQGGRLRVDGDAAAGAGGPSLREALAGAGLREGAEIVVPDVEQDADLDRLVAAHAGADGVLWCGSAGLALALARARAGMRAQTPSDAGTTAGEVLVATASRHAVLRAQLEALRAAGTGGRRLRIADFSSAGELAPAQAADALALGAAGVVAEVPAPGLLVAIGGDSLLALCQAAQVRALVAGAPPRPGWGSARLCGGRWDGVPCLSRSGAFGAPDDLAALLASLGAAAPFPISPESLSTTS